MLSIRRALISVSDKTGVVDLARGLAGRGVEILSTGGTARLLTEQDIPVTEVSDYTGFPEMMGGRVKTLHPRVHGGILGRRGVDDPVMGENEIKPIDLVVVNLYPFEETVADPSATWPRPSRTSTSVALPCCGPQRRTTPGSPSWWTPATTRGSSPSWRCPGVWTSHPLRPRREGLRAHRGLRRGHRQLSGPDRAPEGLRTGCRAPSACS